MATALVIATVVVVVAVIAVLLRQGSVGRLSEEDGHRPPGEDVVERPAGPGAEPMHPDPPGRAPGDVQPPPDTER